MTRKLVLTTFAVLAICMSLLSKAAAAEPELAGNWNITFYLEPGHFLGATQCVVFTRTGNVVGEPNSGS